METAASGEEGLTKAEARLPDLIFLDLRMPGIDGVETLRRLQGCCLGVPVYIVTAFRQEFTAALAQAAAEGLRFHVMDKPLKDEQIRTVVRAALVGPQAL